MENEIRNIYRCPSCEDDFDKEKDARKCYIHCVMVKDNRQVLEVEQTIKDGEVISEDVR